MTCAVGYDEPRPLCISLVTAGHEPLCSRWEYLSTVTLPMANLPDGLRPLLFNNGPHNVESAQAGERGSERARERESEREKVRERERARERARETARARERDQTSEPLS